MSAPTVGLLPLYLALYDDALPEVRPRVERFVETMAGELRRHGLSVAVAPVCRVEGEFRSAVRSFEDGGADAIVTLHLAYSPSLESVKVLAGTRLPILVLDTTPDEAFGPDQSPEAIMANHGIHGVQDLCNVLRRRGKAFQVEAGHWEGSDVLDRVARWARSARLASAMRHARVGRIGRPFRGMGDFAVPPERLRATVGVETVPCDPAVLSNLCVQVSDQEVAAEMGHDLSLFDAAGVDPEAHRRSVRAGLAVRRWIEREQLTGFTVNFLDVDRASGLPTVPFLEASKAMARGLGYAGEGDVLTAALVGALAAYYPETTFTEMFCPDWAGESIFLSHMGEMNLSLVAGRPRLFEKPFPWTDADNPVVALGRLRGGEAVWVDLAPGPEDSFTLVVAPGKMLDVVGEDRFVEAVRGWFRPALPVADFLAEYSRAGGTHHAALVYGAPVETIAGFGRLMGWGVKVIR